MDLERFHHAIVLRDSGQVEEALRELDALVRSTADPEEKSSLMLNEARCFRLLGRFDDATRRLREATRVSPRTQHLLYLYFEEAVLDWHQQRREQALRRLDGLLHEHVELLASPEHRDLYKDVQIHRGILLTELGRFQDARPVLEEALALEPQAADMAVVSYNLGVCRLKAGQIGRAKEEFLSAIEKGLENPYLVSAHYCLGAIHSREGAHAKALREFEWCLAHAGEGQIPKAHIYAWLATTASSLGLTQEAEQYEKLAKG